MFEFLIIRYKKVCNSLNISPIKILQRINLSKILFYATFVRYVTFSEKIDIKRDI